MGLRGKKSVSWHGEVPRDWELRRFDRFAALRGSVSRDRCAGDRRPCRPAGRPRPRDQPTVTTRAGITTSASPEDGPYTNVRPLSGIWGCSESDCFPVGFFIRNRSKCISYWAIMFESAVCAAISKYAR